MSGPIPILMTVYQLDLGGNERDLSLLARHLNPELFRAHAAAFRASGERRRDLDAAGVPAIELPVRSFHNVTAWRGARVLREYIRANGIRLIHAFDAPTSIYTTAVGRILGIPVISNHCYFRPLIPPPNRYALRMVDRLAARIVVNAAAVKRHLIEDYRIAEERICVSWNGFEAGVFYPEPVPRPAGLEDASLVVGSLCVLREEKRIDVLLEAFAEIRGRDPGMRLLIVGDGPMRESWIARSIALGLGGVCRFERATSGVPGWLRAMDVFVLPSRSEGFPNALLEAMACGCAVAASRVGGVPEMIEDGRTGLLFSPGNPGELAAKLAILTGDPALRRKMGADAAQSVRERFSIEQAARRMEKIYASVLET